MNIESVYIGRRINVVPGLPYPKIMLLVLEGPHLHFSGKWMCDTEEEFRTLLEAQKEFYSSNAIFLRANIEIP